VRRRPLLAASRLSAATSRGLGGALLTSALVLLAACDRRNGTDVAADADGRAEAADAGAQGDATRSPNDAASPFRFRDATAGSGLDLVTTSGRMPSSQILEVKGGGLVLIDFDRDGLVDLFVPNGATLDDPERGPGARLFRNEGGLRFRDVTAESGITHRRWSFGGAAGDVDGDSFDDLVIACFGPNVLLRNRGDGTFEDVSAASGIEGSAWTTSMALADLDLDGDLDLCETNYLEFDPRSPPAGARFKGIDVLAGPRGLVPAADRVLENLGHGTFRDRTADAGFAVEPGYGLNLAVADFSGDGKPDLYVGNDSQPNRLFVQQAPWQFEERGMPAGLAVNFEGNAQATMGIALGDVDGNGRPDLFTSNFSSDTNTLHLNLDGRFFDDRTAAFGLGAPSRSLLGWAAGFFDFDLDGAEDLLVVNGHVYPQATIETMDSAYAQPPLLFHREGSRFRRVESAGSWPMEPRVDRTAVFADFDDDGDVDAVIGELNGPLRLIANESDPAGDRWLRVRLRDDRPGVANRRGIGAVVSLEGAGTAQRRWLWSGGPFQSNLAPEAHFGFASTPGPLVVVVQWPDGVEQRVDAVSPGAVLDVVRRE
jgi:hypothetical protein